MKALAALIVALALTPHVVRAADAAQSIYVLCQDAAILAVIDTHTDEITERIKLSGKPASFAINPVSGEAFVTQPETGKITVIDLKRHAVERSLDVGGQPFGIASGPNGRLYVGDWSANHVSVVDGTTGDKIKSIAVGRSPAHLSLSADGSRLFVANRESNSISVIDTEKLEIAKEIGVGHAPFALALTPDERRLVVANVQSATLSIIDTSNLRVLSAPETRAMPYGVAIAKNNTEILVSNQASGSVSVLDAQTRRPRAQIKVGRYPEGLAVIQNGSKAYVANWFSSSISVIDLKSNTEIKRFKCPDGPRLVVAGPSEH